MVNIRFPDQNDADVSLQLLNKFFDEVGKNADCGYCKFPYVAAQLSNYHIEGNDILKEDLSNVVDLKTINIHMMCERCGWHQYFYSGPFVTWAQTGKIKLGL